MGGRSEGSPALGFCGALLLPVSILVEQAGAGTGIPFRERYDALFRRSRGRGIDAQVLGTFRVSVRVLEQRLGFRV